MSATEPDWNWSSARTLRPVLHLRAHAPMRDALHTLDGCLKAAGFRIDERQPAGFQARFVNWWALVVNDLERSAVVVSATESSGATDVLVAVVRGAEHRRASQRAARGLESAVQQLRERHVTVSTGGWTAPDTRRP